MNNLIKDMTLDCNRRDFIKMSAGAMAALAATTLPLSITAKAPSIKAAKISLKDCLAMDPITMAEKSSYVKSSYDYLLKTANEIQDIKLRRSTIEILQNPAPRLLELYPSNAEKEQAKQRLVAAGWLKPTAAYDDFLPPCNNPSKAVIPFYAAPGSGYGSHHSYPGGLATHVAVNVKAALGFFNAYKDIYGFPMSRDVVIAAQSLHDLHKPWVFQWQKNGASRTEFPIAGQGAHHVLSLAELIHRRFPAEVIVAQACAHNHPGTPDDEREVVSWLNAAAILANQDAVSFGLLTEDGKTLPLPRRTEGFITHLGDHDWVLSVPVAKWMIAKLGEIAKQEYQMTDADLQSQKFYAFRNYVFSQATLEQLYLIWTVDSQAALVDTVKSIVTP
ncbi:twin-arginine translocation signal domain-containing protein [Sporomusa malonica]|uniref:Tat (Twin-arginine translocation) pathway signal sequence n=1 Tax=Sporomusa malonica TaxID=112901 RepID=A0A1W2BPM1_9FIRM|nr:twin-arginine translocation signal domain-containing protein [Sporomusa malonica]SMC74850.1 Tat (twin-arginine translocation) pathway signal sequence [Sporomusa malonica]